MGPKDNKEHLNFHQEEALTPDSPTPVSEVSDTPAAGEPVAVKKRFTLYDFVRDPVFRDVVMGVGLALVFVVLVFLLFKGYADSKAVEKMASQQRTLYAGGLAVLLAGLFVIWLGLQTSKQPLGERPVWFFPLLSGLLTLYGMGLAYIFLGIWPIGDKTCMIVDMHHQYAPLLNKLRNMLLNGSSPFYSFELGLGASFLPAFGYYLASPLNLLLVLFSENLLPEGIFVITLIKNTLCGVTFAICVQYIYRRRTAAIPVVSMMFAMSMYMLAYSWNIMWLDAVMMLPLVVMGFEHLMRTGKYLPYVLSLAYALYANYYIAYMVCLFMVLYFIVYLLRQKRTAVYAQASFVRFFIGSLLGGGLAMFLVLPVFLSLGQTSAAGGELPKLAANFDMFNLLGRHLYQVTPTIRSGNLPNIYCGILTVFLVPVFGMCKAIPARRRVAYIGLVFVLGFSMVINQIDMIWHGLHAPNDLPYRFSFIYSFVLLLIAYEVLMNLDKVELKALVMSLIGIIAYLAIEERFGDEVYDTNSIYFSLLLVAAYFAISLLISKRYMLPRVGYCLLLVVVAAEMVTNASQTIKTLDSNEYYTMHEHYVDNETTRAIQKALATAKSIGDGEANGAFYRLEFAPRRTAMDTAMFNYRGITSFASSNSYYATRFMGALGYAVNGVNSYLYKGFNAPIDSLMGIKYVVLQSKVDNHPQLRLLTSERVNDVVYYIYENTTALPVAFRANKELREYFSNYFNPIPSQNRLFQAMTGDTRELLESVQVTLSDLNSEDVRISDKTAFTFYAQEKNSIANFQVNIPEDGNYYIYVDCRAAKGIEVNFGPVSQSITPHEPYFVDAIGLKAGDVVNINIRADNTCSGNVYVVRLNEQVFEDIITTLRVDGLQVTRFTDDTITGTINASREGVMFTSIPYDPGWTVRVDGKKVETFGIDLAGPRKNNPTATDEQLIESGQGAMLGFYIPAGQHTVEYSFRPKGLVPGIIISLISLGLLVIMALFTGRLAHRVPANTAWANLFDTTDLDGQAPEKAAGHVRLEDLAKSNQAELEAALNPPTSEETGAPAPDTGEGVDAPDQAAGEGMDSPDQPAEDVNS